VSKSDNDEICSTSDGCTSRHRSTWPRLHPVHTVDIADTAADRRRPSRQYRDVDCGAQRQQQQQPEVQTDASSGVCADRRSSGAPRRREWVACVQRQRSAAAVPASAPTPSAQVQRPSTSISAAPPVLRRQKTVTSATDDTAVDSALSAAESPAETTTCQLASDDDLDADNIMNFETVLRCLDSCDKILLRHSTVIT